MMPSHVERGGKSLPVFQLCPQRGVECFSRRLLTSPDDFLLGDVARVDFLCELVHGCVGVLVRVGVNIRLQGLQLFWGGKQIEQNEERKSNTESTLKKAMWTIKHGSFK